MSLLKGFVARNGRSKEEEGKRKSKTVSIPTFRVLPSVCKRRERRIYDREKAVAFSRLKINDLSVSGPKRRKEEEEDEGDLPKTFLDLPDSKEFPTVGSMGETKPIPKSSARSMDRPTGLSRSISGVWAKQ